MASETRNQTDLAVADLLEQEEKKAAEKKRARRYDDDEQDFIPLDDDESKSRKHRRRNTSSANGSISSREDRPRSRSPRPKIDRYRTRDNYDDYRRSDRRYFEREDDDRHHSRRHRDRDDRDRGHRGGRYRDEEDDGYRRRRGDGHEITQKKRTPEPTDDEKDRRTVFVQQLAARLRTKQLQEFFEKIGPVAAAMIVTDRVSKRSKGVGYVEFKQIESVEKALSLTGQKLLGIPIIVQVSEAEKNRVAAQNAGVPTNSNGLPFHRLYVGNIHFSVSEQDIRDLFAVFGELDFVTLQKEETTGRSKGYGFVQFSEAENAKEALEKMNGFELANRPIRVGLGNDKIPNDANRDNTSGVAGPHAQENQGSSFSGLGGRGQHAGGSGNFDRAGGNSDRNGGASALDDNDVNGTNFNNVSRASLMAKLARIEEPEKDSLKKRTAAIHNTVTVTRCVCIKNMWTQDDTNEPNWKKELETDVAEECNEKYGKVNHISVDVGSQAGEIYVKFADTASGQNAYRGLNGRFFAGNVLTATYVVDAVYNSLFPKAANL